MACAACQNTASTDVLISQSGYGQLQDVNEKVNKINEKVNKAWDKAWRILVKNVARVAMLPRERKGTLDDITGSETLSDLFKLLPRLAYSLQTSLTAKSRTRLFLCTPCLQKSCMVGKGEQHHFMEKGLDLGILNTISKVGIKYQNSATADSLEHLLWPLSWLPLFLTAWISCISQAELEGVRGKYPDPVLYMLEIKRKLLDYTPKSRLRPTLKPVPPLKVGGTLGSSNSASSTPRQRGKFRDSVKQDTMQDVLLLASEVTKAIEESEHGAPMSALETDCNTPTEMSLYYKKRGQLQSTKAIMFNGNVYF